MKTPDSVYHQPEHAGLDGNGEVGKPEDKALLLSLKALSEPLTSFCNKNMLYIIRLLCNKRSHSTPTNKCWSSIL